MPILFLCNLAAAILVVPLPMKGSSTQSPSWVNKLINQVGSASGNAALCFLLLHSVARCNTFVGYAMSRPTQLDIFLPNPLSTLELSLCRSVSLKFFKRLFAQFPTGTITDS